MGTCPARLAGSSPARHQDGLLGPAESHQAALTVLNGIERRPGIRWVLPGVRDPQKALDYDTVHKVACRISAKAGVERITPHILRHRVTTDSPALPEHPHRHGGDRSQER